MTTSNYGILTYALKRHHTQLCKEIAELEITQNMPEYFLRNWRATTNGQRMSNFEVDHRPAEQRDWNLGSRLIREINDFRTKAVTPNTLRNLSDMIFGLKVEEPTDDYKPFYAAVHLMLMHYHITHGVLFQSPPEETVEKIAHDVKRAARDIQMKGLFRP